MTAIWTASQLEEALDIEVNRNISAGQIQFNSKDVQVGDLFIALQGGARDGHIYVADALKRGAEAVIVCDTIDDDINPQRVIKVKDTAIALRKLAEYKRKHSKAKFIAITGSVGKTSTKEMTRLALQPFGNVFAGRGNFNNHIGLPINLASLPNDVEYAIFELGMNHKSEIAALVELVRPDIALITTVSEAHLANFESVDEIVNAKCEIFSALSTLGIAIIDLDNQYYTKMLSSCTNIVSINNVYTFGKHAHAAVQLESYEFVQEAISVVYKIGGKQLGLFIQNLIPEYVAKNFAAALAVVLALKLDLAIACRQLHKFKLLIGRGNILSVQSEHKLCKLLCDYYNASPASFKAALQYFAQMDSRAKSIVIGDMLELGNSTVMLHQALVPFIVDAEVQKVYLVGNIVHCIKSLLPQSIQMFCFDNVDMLSAVFTDLIQDGELILIKGSRGMKLEKLLTCFEKPI